MSKQTEAMKLALEGAANYIDTLGGDSRKYRQALANEALDRMADNARELGLDYTITQTGVGIGKRAEEAYEAAKERGWIGLSDHRLMEQSAQTDWEAVAADQALSIALLKAEQPAQQEPVAIELLRYHLDAEGYMVQDKNGEWIEYEVFADTRLKAREPLTDEQKDAARWRFLVGNSFDKDGVTQFHVWEHSWEPHSQTGEPTEWKQRVRGPALDRFIDRAIEAAHGIKGDA